jgi:hypothetical protein
VGETGVAVSGTDVSVGTLVAGIDVAVGMLGVSVETWVAGIVIAVGTGVSFGAAHATMSKAVQNSITKHLDLQENMEKRNLLIMSMPPVYLMEINSR